MGFWLGTWEGTIDREAAVWLRFYDTEGNLVLLPEEVERQKAEIERLKAEQAQQQAEEEQTRAEQAELKAARLAEKLRAMGIDPDAESE